MRVTCVAVSSVALPMKSMPAARQNRSKDADTSSHALPIGAFGIAFVFMLDVFMGLLSFRESAPRAYRLKASNAPPPISTFPGAIPAGFEVFVKLRSVGAQPAHHDRGAADAAVLGTGRCTRATAETILACFGVSIARQRSDSAIRWVFEYLDLRQSISPSACSSLRPGSTTSREPILHAERDGAAALAGYLVFDEKQQAFARRSQDGKGW
jgi:hypothetical protein